MGSGTPPKATTMAMRVGVVMVVTTLLLWVGRAVVVELVLSRSSSAARGLARMVGQAPQPRGDAVAPGDPGAQPLWDWDLIAEVLQQGEEWGQGGAAALESGRDPTPEAALAEAPAPRKLSRESRASPSLVPAPRSFVPAELVLVWARSHVEPRGRPRDSGQGFSAGIELSDVAGLGIGLRDGDRLVAVEGQPVTDRGAVVRAVLGARLREQAAIGALVERSTPDGVRSYSISIEQPYLSDVGLGAEMPLDESTVRPHAPGSP